MRCGIPLASAQGDAGDKPMNIVHVTDELMPSAGGLVSVPTSLAASQATQGHRTCIVGRTGADVLLHSRETDSIQNFSQVEVVDSGHPGLLAKIIPYKAVPLLARKIKTADYVHLHGVWDPILFLASRVARRNGVSYVVTPHSMLHPWQMERYVWQKKVVFALGWRRMFRQAGFIHALNDAEKEYINQFGFGAPVEILPNGVFAPQARPGVNDRFLEAHPQLKGKSYILFLSRLHVQKGTDRLLEAFEAFHQRHPGHQLVVAGPDYGERGNMERKLESMPGAANVHLTGPLYGDVKIGALQSACCFVQPSRNEGFSVSILEALSHGLPVIITKNCFFDEVTDHGAGIVTDGSPEQLSQALASVVSDEGTRRRMSENAKRLVREKYNWDEIAKRSIRLYEKHQGAFGRSN